MSEVKGSINWFPGHMRKALNEVGDNLKYVDVVFETVDARIPISSRNPELDKLVAKKPRIVVLNKADLADEKVTNAWLNKYKEQGIKIVALTGVLTLALDSMKATVEAFEAAGIRDDVKILIGGNPVSAESCAAMKADAWAHSPADSVKICKEWAGK